MPDDGAGGFLPDDDAGGGFMLDGDGGGGGFVPEDDGGGFVPDDDAGFTPSASASAAPDTRTGSPSADERIPLRLMPTLLGSLGLPSDEDVLSVFRAIGEGEGTDGGVRLKDFRAVCAALMSPEEDGGEAEDEPADEEAGEGDEEMDFDLSSGSEDEFEPTDDEDDAGDADYGAPVKATRRTRKTAMLEEKAAPKLSGRQRELARELWTMLKPDEEKGRGGGILSRDEVKRWVRDLGEMWSDAEVSLRKARLSKADDRSLIWLRCSRGSMRAGD